MTFVSRSEPAIVEMTFQCFDLEMDCIHMIVKVSFGDTTVDAADMMTLVNLDFEMNSLDMLVESAFVFGDEGAPILSTSMLTRGNRLIRMITRHVLAR